MADESSIATGPAAAEQPKAGDETNTPKPGTEAPNAETTGADGETKPADGETGEDGEKKPEKSEQERELARLRRGLDRKTRAAYEAKARAEQLERELQGLRGDKNGSNVDNDSSGDEPLRLTRRQLQEIVTSEAQKLAPALQSQLAEQEQRKRVVAKLEKSLGQEGFDELASNLEDAFEGLTDTSGRTKPIVDALFAAEDPVGLAQWLADPDNLDEAQSLAALPPLKMGRELAKLETKLATQAAKSAKPKASNAPAPLTPARGEAPSTHGPDPVKDPKAWRDWRNEQERKGLVSR